MTYDASVLEAFAARLYRQARYIVITLSLIGAVFGFIAYGTLSQATRGENPILPLGALGICTLIGFAIGQARSQTLRIQAQTILCQVQIERNTRT